MGAAPRAASGRPRAEIQCPCFYGSEFGRSNFRPLKPVESGWLRSPVREAGRARNLKDVRIRKEFAMKHVFTPTMLGAALLLTPCLASAANVHVVTGMQGQPRQTIGTPQTGSATPGHASTAPGSAFNPSGNAGSHYAGTQPQNSKNPQSSAQYDVAGFQQSHK
jgi:hypothetical protein